MYGILKELIKNILKAMEVNFKTVKFENTEKMKF